MNNDGRGFCYLSEDRRLELQGSGVCNLKGFMFDDGVHRNVVAAFETLWSEMKQAGILSSDFTAASFLDITVFIAKSSKFKKDKKTHSFRKKGLEFFKELRNSVVNFLASTIDAVVMQAQANADIENRQIPSRRRRRRRSSDNLAQDPEGGDGEDPGSGSRPRKTRVQVDLETIWEMHEHSSECGLSLPTYVKTKEKDRHGGCHPQTCQMWLRKMHNMYASRASLSFNGVQHMSVATDASRFSGRDTLISVAYTQENDVAVYMNNQVLNTSKELSPGDAMLEDTIEVLAAQRKLERVAAYNLMRALSNQIKHLTQGSVNIANFNYKGTNLETVMKPLTPGHVRIVKRNEADEVQVFVQEKLTGQVTLIDMSGAANVRVLTLQMDQGSPGMSMASFLGGTNVQSSHTIHFTWDPYHRCHRDMRLAMSASTIAARDVRKKTKYSLQYALVCSTFLWSINYKPYNKGAFHQAKAELLENFLASEDED